MNKHNTVMVCRLKMSTKALADFMYAVIMCKVKVINTHGVGIYDLERKHNARGYVRVLLELDNRKLTKFEEMADVKLEGKRIIVHP